MWFVHLLLLSNSLATSRGNNVLLPVKHRPHHIVNDYDENNFDIVPYSSDFSGQRNHGSVVGYQPQNFDESDKCLLEICYDCISKFRHIVFYSEAEFVYLNLIPQDGVSIQGDTSIVGENIWVWTFSGKDGGKEFLKWPMEFGIWSMGLLTSYVITKPIDMYLTNASGNCSNLKIGNNEDDKIISTALLNVSLELILINKHGKYDSSFFCYKQRKYIYSDYLYVLCKHIVCPLEALKYRCCNYYYNTTLGKRLVGCDGEYFEYDPVSWILPTLVSILLFAVCPLFLLKIAQEIQTDDQATSHQILTASGCYETFDNDRVTRAHEFLFLSDKHHVTLFGTLLKSFCSCFECKFDNNTTACQSILKRLIRYCLPFLSLSFILVQVALDYFYLHTFILTSIKKGVPLGFRSMLAGYEASRQNFLPFLGGPFVAVGVYLLITFVLLGIPSSVSRLLWTGLPTSSTSEDNSPLFLKLSSIEYFGSVHIRRRLGIDKIYVFLLGQLFMLINGKFWRHTLRVQYRRWVRLYCSQCLILVFLLYVVACLVEIALCVVYYGCPILPFGCLIIKAYCGRLWKQKKMRSFSLHVLFILLTLFLVSSVLYFFFILCTIFMDACLFITRVVTFTFTGVVVYPKEAYGYIIFFITVVYYIMQSLHDFSSKYQTLLKETITVCEQIQRANDANKLVARMNGFKGISKILFERVIEEHCPRRKQVFLSFVKVCVILTILGISLNVLNETNGFRELHTIMHVGTALFICALPQIVKSTCRNSDDKIQRRRFRIVLAKTVRTYSGYFNTGETSDSEIAEVV